MRGRPPSAPIEPVKTTYTRIFKGEDCDTIWYYDTNITTNGPIRVDIKWHLTPKQMNTEMKAEKAKKSEQRRVNKFFKDKENDRVGLTRGKTRGRKAKS